MMRKEIMKIDEKELSERDYSNPSKSL
jgi:hypothetical protein